LDQIKSTFGRICDGTIEKEKEKEKENEIEEAAPLQK